MRGRTYISLNADKSREMIVHSQKVSSDYLHVHVGAVGQVEKMRKKMGKLLSLQIDVVEEVLVWKANAVECQLQQCGMAGPSAVTPISELCTGVNFLLEN